jgi:hypothetical protein
MDRYHRQRHTDVGVSDRWHRPHRRALVMMCCAATLAGVLGACRPSTDTREHQRLAASSLVKQAADRGVELVNAKCEEPETPDVGATLACTAEDQDGFVFNYVVTIATQDSYEITPEG